MSQKILSDAQILAKTSALLDTLEEKWWPGYEKKGMKKMFGKMYPNCVKKSKKKKRKKRKNEEIELYEEKVLLEIEEDEMRVLEDVLDDLDGHKLSLSNVFDQQLRKVIDFPTMDTESELGSFVDFFTKQEYNVQWDKGIVSAVRRVVERDANLLDIDQISREKKFQMKIGKLFAKIADLTAKQTVLFDKLQGWAKENFKFQSGVPDYPGEVTGRLKEQALSEEEAKAFDRIFDQLRLYIPNPGVFDVDFRDQEEWARKNAKYWQENAGYIKKNIQNLTNDKYSIIITRHPIDVLRMSDFKNITSCHSPASRTNAYQSYYKCAVAEAQGHGAVAYVVETEELLSATNTGNIQSAEQEIQEGEIFYDDKRYNVGDIRPISRVRLRKMRYEEGNETGGEDLAVPEKRVYGAAIPGFVDRVVEWARESQQEQIENFPKKDGKYDLDEFTLYGGSYEDTQGFSGRQELMMQLIGTEDSKAFYGRVGQDSDTEEDLDADLLGDIRGMYEDQCEEIEARWNNTYAASRVSFAVDDDGADGVYISAFGEIMIEWDVDEFTSLPTWSSMIVNYTSDAINDLYGDLLSDNPYLSRAGGNIVWRCRVNMEHPDLGGQSFFAMPEEFDEFCSKLDTVIDDKRDAFKEILSNYFRREGVMQGGAYINLAINIENGDVSSYEWDVETDGEYDDSYESAASYSFDYDPEEWKINPRVLFQILDSRDYKIALRRNLLYSSREQLGISYYLPMETRVVEVGGEARVTVKLRITRDDPDPAVELFQHVIEDSMDDEDELTVVFNKTLAQIKTGMNSGVWPEKEGPATSDLSEQLVNSWRKFIL